MPAYVDIPDPQRGPDARGRVRVDRRGEPSGLPTLIVVGGLTQTISSWGGQIRDLARSRDVVVYETRGQGGTELAYDDVSFPRHVEDFVALLDALDLHEPVDVSGFSFGGRVTLAVAATQPARIRRCVLTGVGADRSVVGRVLVRGWNEALKTGDLAALAWISLADTLGPEYLERYAANLEHMIRAVCERNEFSAIEALFRQTSTELEQQSPWSPTALAERVTAPALVMGGALDRLAPPSEVESLARLLRGRAHVFDGIGHTAPIEAPQAWREQVLAFLGEDDTRAGQ